MSDLDLADMLGPFDTVYLLECAREPCERRLNVLSKCLLMLFHTWFIVSVCLTIRLITIIVVPVSLSLSRAGLLRAGALAINYH